MPSSDPRTGGVAMMTVGSLFSGVGGFDLGFRRAGFTLKWMCEIDKDCRDVLCKQFPDTEVIYSDVRTIPTHICEPVDIICGGFPCQDVSVAGRRSGLDGERSGLWFEYHRILREMRPAWCVIENVPGLLSSCGCATCRAVRRILRIHAYLRKKRGIHQPCAICRAGERMLASHRGRDFAIILRGLVELGYGVSWRIFNAQYNGVPQRRRRLFIVGHLGDGRAAEVLFESACVPGNPPPRREAGQRTTGIAIRRAQTGSNGWGIDETTAHTLDGTGGDAVLAHAVTAHAAKGGDPTTDNYLVGSLAPRDFKGVGSQYVNEGKVIAAPLVDLGKRQWSLDSPNFIAHALSPEGADASEDGTGRGTPLVAVGIDSQMNGDVEGMGPLVSTGGSRRQAVAFGITDDVGYSLRANPSHSGDKGDGGVNTTMVAFDWQSGGDVRHNVSEHHTSALQASQTPAVAFAQNQRGELRTSDIAPQLTTGGGKPGEGYPATMSAMGVRRLTPVECERLMGWEDGWTAFGASGKEMSDSTRYKMCGNGVVSNVAEYIAQRIMAAQRRADQRMGGVSGAGKEMTS